MATTWFKPAGTSVFPLRNGEGPPSVHEQIMLAQPWRKNVDWPEGFDAGIAHRLDIHTSGALWVAESTEELEEMRVRFREGRLTKHYLMVAAKDVPWDDNTCTRAIGHDKRKKSKMVVRRGEHTPHRGRWWPAHTTFRRHHGHVWDVTITTGVMHQIRVHAAFVGIPLLGDSRYGGGPPPQNAPSGGFFLHHRGLTDDSGWGTTPVDVPSWMHPIPDQS